jgi:hypothetical protein
MTETSTDLLQHITEHLFRIPEEEFLALARELEQSRRHESRRPRANAVLSLLRKRLAIARPPRQMTTMRLFCAPFEEILYTPGRPRKAVGKIPRSAIRPIWQEFRGNVDAARLKAVEDRMVKLELGDAATASEIGTELWRLGGATLRQVIGRTEGNPAQKRELIERLGGENHMLSLIELTNMLEVADPVMQLRATMSPGPLQVVTNADMTHIVEAFTAVTKRGARYQECVVYVIMARLAEVGMIVDVLHRIVDEGNGAAVSQVSEAASEAMVSQVEDRIRDIEEDVETLTRKEELSRRAESMVKTLDSASRSVGSSGSRQQSRRVDRAKTELTDLVRRNIIDSQESDAAALALKALLQEPGAETGPLGPGGDLTDEMIAQIQDRIVSLKVTDRYARELGLWNEVGLAIEAIERGLEERGSAILNSLSNGAASRDELEINLYATVRLLELASGPERADKLRCDGVKLLDEW